MPSKSKSQARLMAAAAHDPAFAKKVGVPQKVARDFNSADAGTGILKGPRQMKGMTPLTGQMKAINKAPKRAGKATQGPKATGFPAGMSKHGHVPFALGVSGRTGGSK